MYYRRNYKAERALCAMYFANLSSDETLSLSMDPAWGLYVIWAREYWIYTRSEYLIQSFYKKLIPLLPLSIYFSTFSSLDFMYES